MRTLTEVEALSFHMVAATSTPPKRYVPSWDLAEAFVRFRNMHRLDAFFTYDTGANMHLLFLPGAKDVVMGFVATQKHMYTLHRGVSTFRYRAIVISGSDTVAKPPRATPRSPA